VDERPPTAIAALIDRLMEIDRQWFEDRPSERAYMRPAVPGEFWPHTDLRADVVVVEQVVPGLRMRRPCLLKGAEVER
jgi:hypothetical protein